MAIISQDFEKIMSSGDKAQISLYGDLLGKLTSEAKAAKAEGRAPDLAGIMKEFDEKLNPREQSVSPAKVELRPVAELKPKLLNEVQREQIDERTRKAQGELVLDVASTGVINSNSQRIRNLSERALNNEFYQEKATEVASNLESVLDDIKELKMTKHIGHANKKRIEKMFDDVYSINQKIVEGKSISPEEFMKLEEFSELVMNSLSAENQDTKNALAHYTNTLNNLVHKVNDTEQVLDDKKVKYNETVQSVADSSVRLNEAISKLSGDQKSAFTSVLSYLSVDYENILANGNEVQITLYSALMEKLIAEAEAAKAEGREPDLSGIMKEYNDIMAWVKGEKAEEGTPQYEAELQRLKSFIGDDKFAYLESLYNNEQAHGNKDSKNIDDINDNPDATKGLKDKSGSNKVDGPGSKPPSMASWLSTKVAEPVKGSEDRDIMRIGEDIIKDAETITLDMINRAFENEAFRDAFKDFGKSVKELNKSRNELTVAYNNNTQAINDLRGFMTENNIFDKLDQEFFKNMEIQIAMDQAINEFIENAEMLMELLNFDFDSSDPLMVSLLEKFRQIISTLDVDLRAEMSDAINKKLIDVNFLRKQKENMDSEDRRDNFWQKLLEEFNSSKEVEAPKIVA